MGIVKTYMTRTLNSVGIEDSVGDVIIAMYKAKMAVLPVVDDDNNFLGTIYSKNFLKNIIPEEYGYLESHRLLYDVNQAAENLEEIKNRKVKEYMLSSTTSVKEESNIDNIANIMLDNKESYLYVINNNGKLRGYISRADLLYYLLKEGTKRK